MKVQTRQWSAKVTNPSPAAQTTSATHQEAMIISGTRAPTALQKSTSLRK